MPVFVRIFLFFCFLYLCTIDLIAQDYISPVSSYSFKNNTVVDDMNYSQLNLRNNTALFNDSQRGSVLRFSALSKSYAAFNKKLLDSDSCTISFFFYWESTSAGSWHQLFELHDPKTNTNLFFTPQNGWGSNTCSVICDNKEYSSYEAVNARQLLKGSWMHVAITFQDKLMTVYINGVEESKGYLTFTPISVKTDSLFLGGNPHRSNNFYISARLDEIKIFNKALAANQVLALAKEQNIPAPINQQTSWEPVGNPVQLLIDYADKKQTIQNFGSSDGWNTQRIGKCWPESKKEKLAELLFSTGKDGSGNPKGIGLSAWRFNIGAGTTEQGETSRISNEDRRTECFLNPDGSTYNWNKQIGQQYFLRKAALDYKINHLIGWQNSPPVQFTTKNLGFRDYGAPMATILKTGYFDEFAGFLADVIDHFKNEGIEFDYISPLNEPQWGWAPSSVGGTVTQEGTPWTNQEIYDVVNAIDAEFVKRNIASKIFITEAGAISRMVGGTGHADSQLTKFWTPNSSLSLTGKKSFANIVSYHSYFQDYGNSMVTDRTDFYNKSQLLESRPELWQTEYSLLQNGYRAGYPDGYKLTEMECALSLAKVVMVDLNIANTTGWQWWTTFEKGKQAGEARFCLIEAVTNNTNTDGEYHLNKLFYTYGNFSHFIRPGMKRLGIKRSDNLTPYQEISNVMLSAYSSADNKELVLVAANFANEARELNLTLQNILGKKLINQSVYLTDEYSNLRKQNVSWSPGKLIVPAKSVVTYTAELSDITSTNNEALKSDSMSAYYRGTNQDVLVRFSDVAAFQQVRLFDLRGNLLYSTSLNGATEISIPAQHILKGIYILTSIGSNSVESVKIVIK